MANSQAVAKADPRVLPCTCKHDFQDARFGRSRRLHNPTMKSAGKDGPSVYRCTVCGALNNA